MCRVFLGNVESLDLKLSSEDSNLDSLGEESVMLTDASESDVANVYP